jgi:hypothetical protein
VIAFTIAVALTYSASLALAWRWYRRRVLKIDSELREERWALQMADTLKRQESRWN